ncbi:MAG: flagellar motor protein MotB, partial [Parahaliea sp.]
AVARVKPSVEATGSAPVATPELGYQTRYQGPATLVPLRIAQTAVGGPMVDETAKAVARLSSESLARHSADGSAFRVARDASGVQIQLGATLLFPSGSAVLLAGAMPLLGELASLLNSIDNTLRVEGFTDNVPITNQWFSSNWELSAARAAAVVGAFVELGVNPGRMSIAAFGDQQPIADNGSEAGRERNRRVVLHILDDPSALASAGSALIGQLEALLRGELPQ